MVLDWMTLKFGRRELSHKQYTQEDKQTFMGLVSTTSRTNSNQFKFVGPGAGTKI